MFRFWTHEPRVCDAIADTTLTDSGDYFGSDHSAHDASEMPAAAAASTPTEPQKPVKRKRSADLQSALPPSPSTEFDSPSEDLSQLPLPKRRRSDSGRAIWPQATFATSYDASHALQPDGPRRGTPPSPPPSVHDTVEMDAVKDVVQYQFSHEILLKHNELRLIDQELAKCQIALEQLRRCHLIPYPIDCPTPEQMLDIASGRGGCVRPKPGATIPKWSPPFGVVDGPYARHYAKWLIPDPVFDGPLADWPGLAPSAQSTKSRAIADARTTRNSIADISKARRSDQKLQALSNGCPQPKDRAGPCVLKRSDGKVVKLVCTDCHRDNFSSTQGFINHCRIAHKRDYKSHDEAAIHCGHPIEVDTATASASVLSHKSGMASCETSNSVSAKTEASTFRAVAKAAPGSISIPPSSVAPTISTLVSTVPATNSPAAAVVSYVHKLACADTGTANSVLERIHSSYQLCSTSHTNGSEICANMEAQDSADGEATKAGFAGSEEVPFLSRFLKKRRFGGDLGASVEDARVVTDINTASWYADEGYEFEMEPSDSESPPSTPAERGLACPVQPSSAFVGRGEGTETSAPGNSKGASSPPRVQFSCQMADFAAMDSAMDIDLSPVPSANNNAPSLVSDDGEFDDSDDGSASETSDTDMGSVSDIAEINIDEDEVQAHETARPMRHHSGSVKLKKDESKHVSFVSPVKGANGRRK